MLNNNNDKGARAKKDGYGKNNKYQDVERADGKMTDQLRRRRVPSSYPGYHPPRPSAG